MAGLVSRGRRPSSYPKTTSLISCCAQPETEVEARADTTHTGGPEGLRSLCHVKAITEDRLFSLIRTPIPGAVGASVLRFPRLPRWSSSQLVHQCYCRTPAHAGHRFPLTARLDLVGVPPRSRAARIRPEVVVQALGSRRGVAERLGVTVSTSAAQGGFDFTARRPGRVAVGHCIGACYIWAGTPSRDLRTVYVGF
jgi:hypothetical protein